MLERVLIIHVRPVFHDNYAYVCEHKGECWVVDPGAASPIQDWILQRPEERKFNHWSRLPVREKDKEMW